MITAIFTSKGTSLSIETSESLILEQMSGSSIKLSPGVNKLAELGPGVYKVSSSSPVRVTPLRPEVPVYVAFMTDDKDGDFPDPPLQRMKLDSRSLQEFFVTARSLPIS